MKDETVLGLVAADVALTKYVPSSMENFEGRPSFWLTVIHTPAHLVARVWN